MKALLFFLLLLASISGLEAQAIILKSGENIPASNFQRNDDLLMVSIKTATGSKGQLAYHVSDVAELNFPPSPDMAAASDSIAKGHPGKALTQIEPLVAFQQTVRDIPGNYWAKAALIKCAALAALNRTAETAPILSDLLKFSTDPEILTATKLQMTLNAPPKDPAEATAAYQAIIDQSSDARTLTKAWLATAAIHFSEREYDEALMAYLTIPVFYPDHNPFVPQALWGVAQSYAKLKDSKDQDATLKKLVTDYPETPEASLAKAEIKKKEEKL